MIYLENTTEPQRVNIPRTNIEASAYHPNTGYTAGNNIEITDTNVINVTGLTEAIEATISGMSLDFATTGQVETMISSATSGLATTQYVDNSVSGKADTSAVTQIVGSALTSYTPTSSFATINGSGITSGGDLVIEGGGDSTALEKIDTLPTEPVDGALYNYKGRLIKYVNGSGNWGEWLLSPSLTSINNNYLKNPIVFEYAVIPSSMDGQLLYQGGMFNNDTTVKFYFDLTNDCLNVTTASTSTTFDMVIPHDGTTVQVPVNGSDKYVVKWEGNRITINRSGSQYPRYNSTGGCSTVIATAHYELTKEVLPEPVADAASAMSSTYSVVFDNKGQVHPGGRLDAPQFKQNGNWRNVMCWNGVSALSDFWAPNQAGNAGEILVSAGPNGYNFTPPVWKTIAQALGVDFWVGTQSEYESLGTHSNTTLYFIKPNS